MKTLSGEKIDSSVIFSSYINLWYSGKLEQRVDAARAKLSDCDLCGHACHVNRRAGVLGVCHSGESASVSSYGPHFGEEIVLAGTGGSGTIFFTGCNLKCVFCQNWDISHLRDGETVDDKDLAGIMIELQHRGCHNINLVSPSHYLPQILSAVNIACERGLSLPLIWNCGGYESPSSLKLLDGIVDIYMPDLKFADPNVGHRLSGAMDYPRVVRESIREMHRQVGNLKIDTDGTARRGLLVRHLVLPNNLAGTAELMNFVAEEISPETYINIMDQYYPAYKAEKYPSLDRPLTQEEYQTAFESAQKAGLYRLV
jgi:putative pyruvate formate lyase activating enzyme